jgi:hypothetical protein
MTSLDSAVRQDCEPSGLLLFPQLFGKLYENRSVNQQRALPLGELNDLRSPFAEGGSKHRRCVESGRDRTLISRLA